MERRGRTRISRAQISARASNEPRSCSLQPESSPAPTYLLPLNTTRHIRRKERADAEAGFEGTYSVSNFGRVRSDARLVVRVTGAKEPKPQRLKAIHHDKHGYARVRLCGPDKDKTVLVHQLVLSAFVGPCPEGMVGCHNDGNPRNAHLSNLRWDTMKANSADAIRHGVIKRGELAPSARLSAEQVLAIRADTRPQPQIAAEHGVHQSHISRIKTRDIWKHI